MYISLSHDNERFLQSQISAGIYKNINDAVNAAINLFIVDSAVSQRLIDNFNKELESGFEAVKNGDVLYGQTVIEEFRKNMPEKINYNPPGIQ